jgi:8-oxo-dGTP pyrophosphatase MutT (NUDIX family)
LAPPESLPYRLNVGAVLFSRAGQVLVARRADFPNAEGAAGGWQLPQGGIDEGEDPRVAIFRELGEEIGTANAEILAEHPDWLDYDLPPHLIGKAFKGRYRGQRQKWFALRLPTRIRNSTPGAGPPWPTCRPLQCPSSAQSMRRSPAISKSTQRQPNRNKRRC